MGRRKRGNSEGSIYKLQDGRWRAVVSLGKKSLTVEMSGLSDSSSGDT
jgi:hypothetical protein